MLNHSFIHIPSIGSVTERKIWNYGIRTMDDFTKRAPDFFSPNKNNKVINFISLSKEHLENQNPRFFYDHLPPGQHWRIFRNFQNKIAYLDIETNGLNLGGIITTITLYNGKNLQYYVNGLNLDDFKKDIHKYDILITYNGKTFDVPYIERYFDIVLPQTHLDLRYILHSLGFRGGLKACEKQWGIGRTGSLGSMDGFIAVLLWNGYQKTGNQKYLETLLAYNIEDVLSLEYLMISAYNKKLAELPFSMDKIGMPVPPENPFQVDEGIISKIQGQFCRL